MTTYFDKSTISPTWPPGLITREGLILGGTFGGAGTLNQNYIGLKGTLSGSVTNGVDFAPMMIDITATNFVKSPTPGLTPAGWFRMSFGGIGDVGGFAGLYGSVIQTAMTGNQAAGKTGNYTAVTGFAEGNANEGGTAGVGNGYGALFGSNPSVVLRNGATYWNGLNGEEVNIAAATGSSVQKKVGIQVVQTSIDAVQGSIIDLAYCIAQQVNTGLTGWDIGFSAGNYDGYWPIKATGTILGAYRHAGVAGSAGTCAYGVDFSNVTFTSDAFKSTGFSVDPSGNVTVNSLTAANGSVPLNLFQWGVPVGIPPSGYFANNGVFVIGQAPSSSATVSFDATGGGGLTGRTMTFSAATLLGTAADVGRVVTILDSGTYKYATVTAQSSTTVATVTLSAVLSGTGPFANNILWLSGTPTTNTSAFSIPLARVFPAAYMYFPANAIVAGSAAGLRYVVMQSSTVGTVYQEALASGLPTRIVSPTPFSSTGPGAFTQTTTVLAVLSLSVPANSMGPNGSLVFDVKALRPSNVDTPNITATFGGTGCGTASAASILWLPFVRTIRNEGATNSQIVYPAAATGSTDDSTNNNTGTYMSVDTTSAQNLNFRVTLGSGVDWMFYLGGTVTADYAA